MNEKVLDLINEIESAFPVETLTYKGLRIWPILRLTHTYFRTIKRTNSENETSISTIFGESHTGKNTLLNLLKNGLLGGIFFEYLDRQSTKDNNTSSPYLSLLINAARNKKVDGKYFSNILDSLYVFIEEPHQVLEYNLFDKARIPRAHPSTIISPTLVTHFIKAELQTKFGLSSEPINNYDKYVAFLKARNIKAVTHKKYILRYLNRILAYKAYFLKVFKQFQPKVVLMTATYNPVAMGGILACKELGIKSVDVQHGTLGGLHLMYNKWKNMPITGYELLPSHYWVWSHRTAREFKEWNTNCSTHQTIVGGNPWLSFAREWDTQQIAPDVLARFQKRLQNKKQVVLVSLQLIQDFKESCIIEAMQKTDDSFLWLIRLHPRFYKFKPALVQFLEDKNCKNYDFEFANDLPLYFLFKNVSIQVSFWSTVIIEALSFDLHSIIVHPTGFDLMREYVEKGIFRYTLNSEELVQLIKSNQFEPETTDKYIEASPQLIRNTLAELIKV